MKRQNPDQYLIPFDAAKGELMAQIRLLRQVDLGLSAGRSEGVVQLLERLALLGNDLREVEGVVRVKAQVIAIAARVETRCSVSDRTVRNWQTDARILRIVSVDVRSHRFGRKEWNVYAIDVEQIRKLVSGEVSGAELVERHNQQKAAQAEAAQHGGSLALAGDEGGSGRKWAETTAAPGPEMVAAPRPETIAAPSHCKTTGNTHTPLANPADTQPPDTRVDSRSVTRGAVVCAFAKRGVGKASTLVAEALRRGCDTRSLMALVRWFDRSQRRNPRRWEKPGTVLMLRLSDAQPGLPASIGWIPGKALPKVQHRPLPVPTIDIYERRRQCAAELAGEVSAKELYLAARAGSGKS